MDEIQEAVGCRLPAWDRQPASRPGKCRLFPDLDRPTIYREYGLEDVHMIKLTETCEITPYLWVLLTRNAELTGAAAVQFSA
jgi:hypothetical protein